MKQALGLLLLEELTESLHKMKADPFDLSLHTESYTSFLFLVVLLINTQELHIQNKYIIKKK